MKVRYNFDANALHSLIDFAFQQVFCHCGRARGSMGQTGQAPQSLNHTASGGRQTTELVKSSTGASWKLNLELAAINQVEYD